jgi:hypothetical protein
MAKKKISELPAGGALNGTELVPIVQTGTTKRITAQDIANLGNASGVEGSGTINYLAKFTATSTIGNSLIFDNGTNIGIRTASPNHLLTINQITSGGTYFGLYQSYVDGNDWRNWAIGTNDQAFGDFVIKQSNATGGNPNSAGTIRLYIAKSGAASFSSSVTAQGANIGINALGTDRMFQISGNTFTSGATQFAAVINPTMGAVTNLYGIYAGLTCTSATNYYALYLETATGTITNKWGIYQSGSGEKNYFAGNVGINTTSPQAKLHSNADILTGYFQNGTNGIYDALKLTNNTASNTLSGNGARIQFYNNTNNSTNLIGSSIRSVNTDYGWASDLILSSVRNNSYTTQTAIDVLTLSSSGAATFSSSVTAGGNLLINNTSVSKKGYKFQSPASNWGPQESGIFFTPADGVNAATTFSLELWDGNGSITNALSIAPLGAATFSSSVKVGSFTTTQINALSASAGMVVFNTTLATLCFYDGSGWRKVTHSNM